MPLALPTASLRSCSTLTIFGGLFWRAWTRSTNHQPQQPRRSTHQIHAAAGTSPSAGPARNTCGVSALTHDRHARLVPLPVHVRAILPGVANHIGNRPFGITILQYRHRDRLLRQADHRLGFRRLIRLPRALRPVLHSLTDAPQEARPSGDLVIVESPAKRRKRRSERYQSRIHRHRLLTGMCATFSAAQPGVDLDTDFAPRYEPLKERRRELEKLAELARRANTVWPRHRPGPRGRVDRAAHRRLRGARRRTGPTGHL